MGWTKAIAQNELEQGGRKVVKIGGLKVLLLSHDGQLYAVDNRCPHLKMPLKRGKVTDDCALVCPFHRSAFDLKTGNPKTWTPWPPVLGQLLGKVKTEASLPVFPTRIEDGSIWVDVPEA